MTKMTSIEDAKIAVIGLGYVGLPLAVECGKYFPTLGFDINEERIGELRECKDSTLEVTSEELQHATLLRFSSTPQDLEASNVFIVTVPTPIDDHKQPDLTPLRKASTQLGKVIPSGSLIIFESTVYPGTTEEVCVPLLEESSHMKVNQDFYVGYSPERINPGDKTHRVTDIKKVTSGSTPEAADLVDAIYSRLIRAGTYKTATIKEAEAAKVIENTQRDLNIALINELVIIFEKLGIDTENVLKAAATKWNFLNFRPGLVGGHCIGVDPYYLTHKAEAVGYHPEVILSGRRINDKMGEYIVGRVMKLMIRRKIEIDGARVLVMGLAFKENCPDIRNTKVIDIIRELREYGVDVDVYDPQVDQDAAQAEYGIRLISELREREYDAIILAVAHEQFRSMKVAAIRSLGKAKHILFDVKYLLDAQDSDGRL